MAKSSDKRSSDKRHPHISDDVCFKRESNQQIWLPLHLYFAMDDFVPKSPFSSDSDSEISLAYSTDCSSYSESSSSTARPALQRPFYFTHADNYETFAPTDLHGVLCTLEEYFELGDKRFELYDGILTLREMEESASTTRRPTRRQTTQTTPRQTNQPTPSHNIRTANIMELANAALISLGLSDIYYAYVEHASDPCCDGDGPNVRVLDVMIAKRKSASRSADDVGGYTVSASDPILCSIEVASVSSLDKDYNIKKKEQEKRGTPEHIVIDHVDPNDPKVVLFVLNPVTKRYNKTVYRGNRKVAKSRFFGSRTAEQMLFRDPMESRLSPHRRQAQTIAQQAQKNAQQAQTIAQQAQTNAQHVQTIAQQAQTNAQQLKLLRSKLKQMRSKLKSSRDVISKITLTDIQKS